MYIMGDHHRTPNTPGLFRDMHRFALGCHLAHRILSFPRQKRCDGIAVIGELDHLAQNFAICRDALALPWRLYGSGGQGTRTQGLTPERFTQAAPLDLHFPLGHLFKTLHRPSAFRALGVHRPRAKKSKPARWIGPDGEALSQGFASNDGAISLYGASQGAKLAWLNHYSLRSLDEFIAKRARGLPNHMEREIDLTYWAERNWNSVDAPEILNMLEDKRRVLQSLPDVSKDVAVCLAEEDRLIARTHRDLDSLRLRFRLNLLTGSTPPTAEEGHAFLRAQIEILQKEQQ